MDGCANTARGWAGLLIDFEGTEYSHGALIDSDHHSAATYDAIKSIRE